MITKKKGLFTQFEEEIENHLLQHRMSLGVEKITQQIMKEKERGKEREREKSGSDYLLAKINRSGKSLLSEKDLVSINSLVRSLLRWR